jgi:hypothetical protein
MGLPAVDVYHTLSHLKNLVSVLSSIINGACCLTSEDYHELFSSDSKLMPSILLFLKIFSDQARGLWVVVSVFSGGFFAGQNGSF